MFVYLDESGDTGFKFRRGSSKYFVVTLLLVEDPIPVQIAIDELRSELNQSSEAPKVNTIVHHKSHTDNLIQTADMACGAIHRKYHRGDDGFYRLIRPIIQDEWVWQPRTP